MSPVNARRNEATGRKQKLRDITTGFVKVNFGGGAGFL